MKRIIFLLTIYIFIVTPNFAQQIVSSIWSHEDYLKIKKAFFEDKSFQNNFVSASLLCQAYKNNLKNFEKSFKNQLIPVWGNLRNFYLSSSLDNNIVWVLYLEVPEYPNEPIMIEFPLNISENTKNKIMNLKKDDKLFFLTKGKDYNLLVTCEAISTINENGEFDVIFGKNFDEMWNCQYNVSSKNSANELQYNLEKQQCYEYIKSISEAMGEYYEDAVNLTKVLNPNASFDDSFLKEIENSIINNNKEINTKLLKEKGFLKGNFENDSSQFFCLQHMYGRNKRFQLHKYYSQEKLVWQLFQVQNQNDFLQYL